MGGFDSPSIGKLSMWLLIGQSVISDFPKQGGIANAVLRLQMFIKAFKSIGHHVFVFFRTLRM